MEWGESSSPGDFLMRWRDPEAMWMDKAGTAGTEMWEEKEANVENIIAYIGCLWNKYINLWVKGSLPNFLQYPQQWKLGGTWCRNTVAFSITFLHHKALLNLCELSHSKITTCHTVRARKPSNLDQFSSKRGTYILFHLALLKQVLCKSTYSYLGLHLFQVSRMLWDSLVWNCRTQFSFKD